jgi:hypothetical protein
LLSIVESPPKPTVSHEVLQSEQPLSEYKKSLLSKLDPCSKSNIIENYLKAVKSIGASSLSVDPIKYWANADPNYVC